jgi:hypothetical protein
MRRFIPVGLLLLVMLGLAVPSYAQGVQIGTITGTLQSTDDLPLPGVAITARSSALQGERTAISDVNGVYYLRGLPPGRYVIDFAISDFQPVNREDVDVTIGGTIQVNATMALAARAETITVTAEAPSPLVSLTTSQTYNKREIETLPVGRRPVDIAELAPGLTTNTFNTGQLAIAGAYGFDNVFMINGVDINDNIIGSANNLFIEDAIQETTVLTNGIPAAYGRFSGGVVNMITKSGGNTFSGSFRENLSNPSWIEETPREKQNAITHLDVLGKTYEGTLGGPFVVDRLWFFTAGRYEKSNTPNTFAQSGGAYTRTDTNKRGELKFTGMIGPGQTVQGSYINNGTTQANASGIAVANLVDASTLVTRQVPDRLLAVNYNGTIHPKLFASMQYSEKKQESRNNGGRSTNVLDSPFRTLGAAPGVPGGLFYHGPYFDATDPEQRNNRQVTGSVSSLISTQRFGSHDVKGGAEHFVGTGIGGNSQSSTGYLFVTDYLVSSGRPVVDSLGKPIPVFVPGASEVWNFIAARGARIDLKTTSLYGQDRWAVNPRVMAELGLRFETVRGDATGDINTVKASSVLPRLGLSYDLQGDGKTVFQGTYGHYSGKYSQTQFAANTTVGRPSEIDYVYTGPAGQGADFAPGFDVRNYSQVSFGSFPTANVRIADELRSPTVREFTVGLGRELGSRGYAKATYVWRNTSHFVEDFASLANGTTDVPVVGTLTNRVISNTDDGRREYRALILQNSYRLNGALALGGHYSLQLTNHGNFVGEAANQPGLPSRLGDFPEVFGPALDRLMPEGRLPSYQRHKLRLYGTYTQSLGRLGSVDSAPILRVNSGGVYSLTASLPLTAVQLARNPGYPTNDISPFVRQTVFFGEAGEYQFKGYGVFDFATTYSVPVWRSAQPWFKVEIYNLLNNQKQIAWDRTVSVDRSSPLDSNGIPTGYTRGPRFGQATNDNQFPQPYPGQNGGRAFRMAFGVRF